MFHVSSGFYLDILFKIPFHHLPSGGKGKIKNYLKRVPKSGVIGFILFKSNKNYMINVNVLIKHPILIHFTSVYIYMCSEVYNLLLRVDIVNIGFRFIGINVLYIIFNFCCAHFWCGHAIGPHLCFIKRSFYLGYFICMKIFIN